MKKVKSANYRNAFAVLFGKWISINTSEYQDYDEGLILPSKIIDPEKAFLKKEAFENLSNEAKEVIFTILNGPEEIINLFSSPKEKRINTRRIADYYRLKWSSSIIAKSIIEEIKEWAKTLK